MNAKARLVLAGVGGMVGLAAWAFLAGAISVSGHEAQTSLDLDAIPVHAALMAGLSLSFMTVSMSGRLDCQATWWSLGFLFGGIAFFCWEMNSGLPWWVFGYAFASTLAFTLALMDMVGELLAV